LNAAQPVAAADRAIESLFEGALRLVRFGSRLASLRKPQGG